jgi:hypothetical protein
MKSEASDIHCRPGGADRDSGWISIKPFSSGRDGIAMAENRLGAKQPIQKRNFRGAPSIDAYQSGWRPRCFMVK